MAEAMRISLPPLIFAKCRNYGFIVACTKLQFEIRQVQQCSTIFSLVLTDGINNDSSEERAQLSLNIKLLTITKFIHILSHVPRVINNIMSIDTYTILYELKYSSTFESFNIHHIIFNNIVHFLSFIIKMSCQ